MAAPEGGAAKHSLSRHTGTVLPDRGVRPGEDAALAALSQEGRVLVQERRADALFRRILEVDGAEAGVVDEAPAQVVQIAEEAEVTPRVGDADELDEDRSVIGELAEDGLGFPRIVILAVGGENHEDGVAGLLAQEQLQGRGIVRAAANQARDILADIGLGVALGERLAEDVRVRVEGDDVQFAIVVEVESDGAGADGQGMHEALAIEGTGRTRDVEEELTTALGIGAGHAHRAETLDEVQADFFLGFARLLVEIELNGHV